MADGVTGFVGTYLHLLVFFHHQCKNKLIMITFIHFLHTNGYSFIDIQHGLVCRKVCQDFTGIWELIALYIQIHISRLFQKD